MTFVLVLFSWVLFRSDSFPDALQYARAMFGQGGGTVGATLLAAQLYGQAQWLVMAVCAFLVLQPRQAYQWSERLTWGKALVITPVFVLALMTLFTQSFNPFLYFQF